MKRSKFKKYLINKTKVLAKKIKFFVKIKKLLIRKSKVFSSYLFKNHFLVRMTVLAFFLGINIVLGAHFINNNSYHLPNEIVDVLNKSGLVEKEKFSFLGEELDKTVNMSLDPQIILEKLNTERLLFEVNELEYSDSLATAAAILLSAAEEYQFDLDQKDFLPELKDALAEVGYNYSHVSHNMIVGPSLEQAVVNSWFSDQKQIEALKNSDFVEVGFATKIVELSDVGAVGVVVQILGKPMKVVNAEPQKIVSNVPKFPEISDEEVIMALNNYRLDHDIRTLNIDNNLCEYASKRVQDLIAFGGLDNHDGFRKDFEDQDNLPESIKNYSGNAIAENLAHQYCKNMTTGDSFIAETGTAIIEWCFDSSTKGHREAQLNNDYENVCVRHGEGMYVVTFGN